MSQNGTIRPKAIKGVLLLSCVVLGVMLRVSFLNSRPLWVDEAESGINALTILEHGYPSDRYLGLPIYENVLLSMTPESEEYEFRDSSYSNRGMAIYHGWLPLYTMAAAYAVAGIQPDHDDGLPPMVRHGAQEFFRRTVVPRVPSLLFSVLLLACIYRLGKQTSGDETAWAFLVAGAIAQPFVFSGWQARYYSATLALSALSALAVWNVTRAGRWRDATAAGLALVLLFFTHALSFIILTIVLAANVPFGVRHARFVWKLCLIGVIVAVGVVPWMLWTGFLTSAAGIPSAWPLLAFPQDFVFWFAVRKGFVAVIAAIAGLALLSVARPHRLLDRLAPAVASDRHAIYFGGTWFAIAYLSFVFLIPAASFYQNRLTLVVVLPGYLLLAVGLAAVSRAMLPRMAVVVAAPLVMFVLLTARGTAELQISRPPLPNRIEAFAEVAGKWRLKAGTKLYSWPNQNLVLTYYMGLPVQSVAPVRKTFLDSYAGDVILVETGAPYIELGLDDVQAAGRTLGVELSVDDVRALEDRVQRHGASEYVDGAVAAVWPPPEALNETDTKLLATYRRETRRFLLEGMAESPLLRGTEQRFLLSSQWLPVLYRFVNPEKRTGEHLNYRDRMRAGTAIVLRNGVIIFDCRKTRDVSLVDPAQDVALTEGGTVGGL